LLTNGNSEVIVHQDSPTSWEEVDDEITIEEEEIFTSPRVDENNKDEVDQEENH